MPARMVLATRSPGKLKELRPMFAAARIEVVDLDAAGVPESAEEGAVEAFDTFEENALAKARYFHARTGLPAIADDSGLVVDALGGAPGVRSKRWSGRDDLSGEALDDANNARLVAELHRRADRSARYVCVAAYCDGVREITARGETEGVIVLDPRGDGGFGYDPYFHSSELGHTFGESSREAKEEVSHRGRAFRSLIARLGGQR